MKDVDGISRHNDPLIHRYIVQANHTRTDDMAIRLFSYSCDLFFTCFNTYCGTSSTNPSAPTTSNIYPRYILFIISLFVSRLTLFYIYLVLLKLNQSLLIYFFY